MTIDMKDFTPGVQYELDTIAQLLLAIEGPTPLIKMREATGEFEVVGETIYNLPNIHIRPATSPNHNSDKEAARREMLSFLDNITDRDIPIASIIRVGAALNTSIGAHYIACTVRYNNAGTLELVVIDPLGTDGHVSVGYVREAEAITTAFTTKFNNIAVNINPRGTVYQNDPVSCGPVCLANVEAIAKGEFIDTTKFGIQKTLDNIPQFPKNAALLRMYQKTSYLALLQAPDVTPPRPTTAKPPHLTPSPVVSKPVEAKSAVLETPPPVPVKSIEEEFKLAEIILSQAQKAFDAVNTVKTKPSTKSTEDAFDAANKKLGEATERYRIQLDIKTKREALDKAMAAQKLAEKEMVLATLTPSTLSKEAKSQYLSSLKITTAQAALDAAQANMALQESLEKALSVKLQDLFLLNGRGDNQEQIYRILAQQDLISQNIKNAEEAVVSSNENLNKEITSTRQTLTQLTQQHTMENQMTRQPYQPSPASPEDQAITAPITFNETSEIGKYLFSGTPEEVAAHLDRNMQKHGITNNTKELRLDTFDDLRTSFSDNVMQRMSEVGKALEERANQRSTSFGSFMQKIGDYASIVMNVLNLLSSKKVTDPKLAAACSEYKYNKSIIEVGLTMEEAKSNIDTFAARILKSKETNRDRGR